jgi:putative transposase
MAHSNSVFNQFLALISRSEFNSLIKKHNAGRTPRKFSWWNHFVHLLFIQITERKSMRAGIRNMRVSKQKVYHLGAKPASRSTFSDANNTRSASFFEALFQKLFQKARAVAPKHKLPFKNPLYSLDSSTIGLNKASFPWAMFRKNKSGIKLHTLLDHNGYLPSVCLVSEAKTSDINKAKTLKLEANSIVVFDRAYIDYNWFIQLGSQGIFFVTRQKSNAKYTVKARNRATGQGVTSDQVVTMQDKPELTLRRIGYKDPETGKHYKFLTNNFSLDAKTVADIYKERWEIEIFFRWIKQNLKIKAFVGRSENAVLIQIYVALILYLLLSLLKFMSKIPLSLQKMLQILQLNLFSKGGIEELFKPPKKEKSQTKTAFWT